MLKKLFTLPTIDDSRFYKIHASKKRGEDLKARTDAHFRLSSTLSDITVSTGMSREARCEQSLEV
jgi:hypothetical protein